MRENIHYFSFWGPRCLGQFLSSPFYLSIIFIISIFTTTYYSIVYIYHILIYSTGGLLSPFHVLAIVCGGEMNIVV